MPFGDFVNQIPAPIFLLIHLTAVLIGGEHHQLNRPLCRGGPSEPPRDLTVQGTRSPVPRYSTLRKPLTSVLSLLPRSPLVSAARIFPLEIL